ASAFNSVASMAVQIPMIQIPWKRCEEADWVASLRRYISGVLEQNPDEFLEPIYELHRLRQDTRGVNMDVTGRDLLYRYFSQLELLDLRFQLEKKPLDLSFTWTDVFGQSAVTQSSLAFEKACVIFNMGSILSNLGTYQDRSEPEGLRKANHFFMFAASMLQFIGENFIHAPSEDLSANTLRVLQQLMLAQAQECFLERCLQEMKKDTLIAKIANQNAWMYTNVVENMSECFKNRAFEEQWLTVCQIKQRYYQAAAQYHKGLACEADGRYGEAVARLTLAESQGAEAFKMAKPFVHIFDPNSPYPLLPDTATCLHDLVLTLRELVKEKLAMLTRDNDMIYHEVVPKTSILPPIDKICMVKTHPLHEMYTSPGELQRVVGRDLFIQVVPMQVHESASVYDEEKAKLIRQVMDKVDAADSELDSAFAFMQLPSSLTKFRSGESNLDASLQELADPPPQVHEWAHHIAREENSANVLQELVTTVESLRARIRQQLDASGMALDEEQRECERLRVEYGDDWTQVPSGALAAQFRKEIRSRRDALDQAYVADSDTLARYQQVQPQLMVLRSGPRGDALVGAFAEMVETSVRKWRAEHHDEASTLLDVEDEETTNILQYADQIDETANQLTQLKRDRQLVLQELKDTSRQDDISHILLLNRRNKDLEPQIFTNELNKYTPIVEKVDHTVDQQRELIQSLSEAFKLLMDHPEAARIQQAWDTVEMQRDKLLQQLQDAYENYGEVKANAQQGVTFYTNLANLVTELSAKVQSFGRQRRE
ncbi:bck1-like resistance to osmotic shock, partial [Dimargaris xerosporica]